MSHEIILLIVGLLLTVGTGLFVASEFTLVNLDRAELEARRDRGESMLGPVIRALRVTSTHLSSAQLGITLTTLLAGFTLEPAFSSFLRPPLTAAGLPDDVVPAIATVLAVLIATLISMIVGELVPKNFALAIPREVAKIVIPFQLVFTTTFRPFVFLLNGTANAILKAVGIEPKEELSSVRTADELKSLVRRSAHLDTLPQSTATLLSRTLVLADHVAADVMTPRLRMVAIGADENADAVIALARSTGFSRFPVMGDDVDDIVGVVHVKRAVSVPRARRAKVPVSALQSQHLRVPETMRLDRLLTELRGQNELPDRGFQLAVVEDEYGGTAGLVTLEDLVEELVGDVFDEHDRDRLDIVKRDGSITFLGSLRPDELLERADVAVPEGGPWDTVAGWMLSEFGHIPKTNEFVKTDAGVFLVVRMDDRRIDRVRFTPAAPKPEGGTS